MSETFREKRKRFLETLDQADTVLTDALAQLDDLPGAVTTDTEARQLLDAHQTTRETIRALQRRLEKL